MRTRTFALLPVALVPAAALSIVMAVALAACGGSSKPAAVAPTTPSTTVPAVQDVSSPSKSAKMVCESEAENDIQQAIGEKVLQPLTPNWVDSTYACRYVFKGGSMLLSVKEVPTVAGANAYFDQVKKALGVSEMVNGLGQGGFVAKNDNAVVVKDNKVLVVDVQALPKKFGSPSSPRSEVALNVAATIMGCWTGA